MLLCEGSDFLHCVVTEVEGKSKKPTTVDFSTKNKTATDS